LEAIRATITRRITTLATKNLVVDVEDPEDEATMAAEVAVEAKVEAAMTVNNDLLLLEPAKTADVVTKTQHATTVAS
jgi:predicted nucleic acid-binding protein